MQVSTTSSAASSGAVATDEMDPIKQFYPFVDEKITPLPRCWSTNQQDKHAFLGVSHNNLRVTYRGAGKNHKDAAAVRTVCPIPATCGLYYFEVKIVSKGRDGYMGIGLCQREVNTNRLPGWDRSSYGYHGDDGNFFCSSGTGVAYGPTFTTGDVIGCGLNMVTNSIFYTKNGHNLGTAFSDLPVSPSDLHPTVGLQTPGEIVDTNFGQSPFLYDIHDEMREARLRVRLAIETRSLPFQKIEWFNKIISSYLVHHGYCASAESFNQLTSQTSAEDIASIKNRQEVRRLILSGKITDAMSVVNHLYPGLLEKKPRLLFTLKCRQFIEMVAGVDSNHVLKRSPPRCSPCRSPSSPSTRTLYSGSIPFAKARSSPSASPRDCPRRLKSSRSRKSPSPHHSSQMVVDGVVCSDDDHCTNGSSSVIVRRSGDEYGVEEDDCAMVVDCENGTSGVENGNSHAATSCSRNATVSNGSASADQIEADDQRVTNGAGKSSVSLSNRSIERLLHFGRELLDSSNHMLNKSQDAKLSKMMNEAFSLLAYQDPVSSPVSHLLDPSQRAPVATALNSAILEHEGLAGRPALETVLAHVSRLREEMAANGVGAAAFADPLDICALAPSSSASHNPPSPPDTRASPHS